MYAGEKIVLELTLSWMRKHSRRVVARQILWLCAARTAARVEVVVSWFPGVDATAGFVAVAYAQYLGILLGSGVAAVQGGPHRPLEPAILISSQWSPPWCTHWGLASLLGPETSTGRRCLGMIHTIICSHHDERCYQRLWEPEEVCETLGATGRNWLPRHRYEIQTLRAMLVWSEWANLVGLAERMGTTIRLEELEPVAWAVDMRGPWDRVEWSLRGPHREMD
jgi:hypothetical protein